MTVWQNLVIPNVLDAFVETLKKALVKMGLDWRQSNLRSGVIACTGNSYCKFAASNTKGHALELANYLDKRFKLGKLRDEDTVFAADGLNNRRAFGFAP